MEPSQIMPTLKGRGRGGKNNERWRWVRGDLHPFFFLIFSKKKNCSTKILGKHLCKPFLFFFLKMRKFYSFKIKKSSDVSDECSQKMTIWYDDWGRGSLRWRKLWMAPYEKFINYISCVTNHQHDGFDY